jgi:hypothetical protein
MAFLGLPANRLVDQAEESGNPSRPGGAQGFGILVQWQAFTHHITNKTYAATARGCYARIPRIPGTYLHSLVARVADTNSIWNSKFKIPISCNRYLTDFLGEFSSKHSFYPVLFSKYSGFTLDQFFCDSEIGAMLQQSTDKADNIYGIFTNLGTFGCKYADCGVFPNLRVPTVFEECLPLPSERSAICDNP